MIMMMKQRRGNYILLKGEGMGRITGKVSKNMP